MGIDNFFQGLGFGGARDYGLGFFEELGGGDATAMRAAQRQEQEREERKGNISALMQNMGIGGNQRALLDMMPQESQLASLYDIQNKNRTDAATAAANAEFYKNMFPSMGITETTLPTPYNESLAGTESGGDYSVVNDEGYSGKYQFGQPRLTDYNRATGQNITMDQFLMSPQIQEDAQAWNVGDTDNYIATNALDQYIGQNIGGVTMTQNGLRAMAHLGGNTGMRKFLESGGQYNPADSNGTRLSDYAQTHAGGLGSQQPTPPMQGDAELMNLMQMRNNPNLGAGQVQYLDMLIKQKTDAMGGGDFDASRYKMVNGQLVDLAAEGGPAGVEGFEPPVDTSAPSITTLTRMMALRPLSSVPRNPELATDRCTTRGGTGGPKVKLTAGEATLTLWDSMMKETAPVINDMEKQFNPANISDTVARNTPIAGNFFKSSQGQKYDAAGRVWAEGALRIATGAAAPDTEVERTKATYFAVAGDTPSTVAFKSQLRDVYARAISAALGRGESVETLQTPMEFLEGTGTDALPMSIEDAIALGEQ